MKKIISAILCAVLTINIIIISPFTAVEAEAATNSYAQELRDLGFPESYIDDLVDLHEKYPNWIFKPFNTGLTWSNAVSEERTPHKQQLIEKWSGNATSMYCKCSTCYKNGNYVIFEPSNWVAASESAVEYYMDPRNFLNESEIFQFESVRYNGTQSQSGVETILKGTWMYDSNITYLDANGKKQSINKKYSKAIMEASDKSGLSAYYLASKIRQEVGGATASAGGASGTVNGYKGIYNYYNINANTGAVDGLAWASVKSTGGGYYTNCVCKIRSTPSTATNSNILYSSVPEGTKVTILETTSKQSDGYKWYKVSLTANGKKYTGYIRSDLIDNVSESKPSYNRPWTSPYISIINGAQWIANNYGDQFTGYLQKFNVNPDSGQLHSHEYMANVQAAAAEAKSTYSAYKNARILANTKTFEIPVFNAMPNESSNPVSVAKVTNLKISGYTANSVSLSWNKVSGADGYQVQVYRSGAWTTYDTTTSKSIKVSGLISCGAYLFRVRAYEKYASKNYYGSYSDEVYQVTRANAISGFKVDSATNSTITLSWNEEPRVTGYRIYKYSNSTKDFEYYATVKAGTTKFTDTGLSKGSTYKYEIIGYRDYRDKMYFGYSTDGVTAKTTGLDAPTVKITGYTNTTVSLSWNAVSNASSYNVMVYRSGGWTTYANTKSTSIKVSGLITCGAYLFKVQPKSSSGEIGPYSNEVYQVTRANAISNFKVAYSTDNAITLSWSAEPRVTGYRIYKYDNSTKDFEYYATVKAGTTTFTDLHLENGTTHKYEILGYRDYRDQMYFGYSNDSITGQTSEFTAPDLKISSYTNNSVTLSWSKVSGAKNYSVQVYRSGGWTVYGSTTGTSMKVSGLITCGAYLFRVQVKETGGAYQMTGPYSNEVYQVTRANAISNFKVASSTDNAITLSWKEEPRVTGYRIYKYDSSTKDYEYYTTVKAGTTTFTDLHLENGTTHKYEIIGYRDYRDQMYFGYSTDGVTGQTSGFTAPDLKISSYTNNSVTLSWSKVSGAKNYSVQVYRSGAWTVYGSTTGTSMKVSGLITCGAYLFRVQVKETGGAYQMTGPYSNEVYQVTRANAIDNFKVDSTTSNSVTLSWDSEDRVTGYRIYKYNDSTKDFEYYATVNAGTTTFTDTGLNKSTTYKYEILGYRDYRDQMYFGYSTDGVSATTTA